MKPAPRHGYTTGACAAAAAKGAALMLRDQRSVDCVELTLPAGVTVAFPLHGQRFDATSAACYVVKDAGDDPDVTNGCEVWAEVTLLPCAEGAAADAVVIAAGQGIGRVTKPGLAVAVGEAAINPVPRQMITAALGEVFSGAGPVRVTITIPDGEERSRRTLNARLGIIGGLSILGTTGIVKPISHQAWTDTLDAALDVAVACGCTAVVLSTGRTSEMAVQRTLTPALPDEAYVMMGDHVGYALRACERRTIPTVILAGQFAKLVKIACGHEQTHVAASRLDLEALAQRLTGDPATRHLAELCQQANTARDLLESSNYDRQLIEHVAAAARQTAVRLAPGCEIKVFLAGYHSEVLYFA